MYVCVPACLHQDREGGISRAYRCANWFNNPCRNILFCMPRLANTAALYFLRKKKKKKKSGDLEQERVRAGGCEVVG